ncbi:DUF6134 family protein [Pelomonas sp. CA6]|uniref:DUF6134 family protein n=1 Tax=Pelomonas sp. CA6 TaxID=2907999 RepID=UPI001F4C0E18|nr:DUF6134 family protein [Pelomonas sp. CA6]MCH7344023.1 DUF6134 family protein [Pelomonas sp. CA6]
MTARTARAGTLALAGALALAPLARAAADDAGAQTWEFEVRLDGRPIGSHRFVVSGPPAAREVESTARFEVRLLGIPVYRYRHQARERWRGDCLQALQSQTDDDGRPARVDLQREDAAARTSDCLMSFAYWHPALSRQSRLLNPQTGRIEEVRFERLPDATVQAGGQARDAERWRLRTSSGTPPQDLTLWLDKRDGRWLALDAQVAGGRQLSYRLP